MDEPAALFTTLAVSAALKYIYSLKSWKEKQKKYELIGKISEIYVYPIKACGGFGLTSAQATRLGIRVNGVSDRTWLVVKPNGDFVTQRQNSALACVRTKCEDKFLVITAPGMFELKVPIKMKTDRSKVIRCRVWNQMLEGQDCGEEAGKWFSKYLKTDGLKLLMSGPDLQKSKTPSPLAKSGDQGTYSDNFCSLLVANKQSLENVNKYLMKPVTFRTFRPSIVVDGPKAFDEECWEEMLIGKKIQIRMLEPCPRCGVTTIDQDSGVKSENDEPLETLRKVRKIDISPPFGVLASIYEEGTINIGDPVYVIRK